jgi:hypothetical protein
MGISSAGIFLICQLCRHGSVILWDNVSGHDGIDGHEAIDGYETIGGYEALDSYKTIGGYETIDGDLYNSIVGFLS